MTLWGLHFLIFGSHCLIYSQEVITNLDNALPKPYEWTHVLKPEYHSHRSKVKDILIVRVYQNRDENESLCRPDLYSSISYFPYINGSESSSLYTSNTSLHSVHYMILNKPLVSLTTVHYQSAVSMISFAQDLTAQ